MDAVVNPEGAVNQRIREFWRGFSGCGSNHDGCLRAPDFQTRTREFHLFGLLAPNPLPTARYEEAPICVSILHSRAPASQRLERRKVASRDGQFLRVSPALKLLFAADSRGSVRVRLGVDHLTGAEYPRGTGTLSRMMFHCPARRAIRVPRINPAVGQFKEVNIILSHSPSAHFTSFAQGIRLGPQDGLP